MPRTTDLIGELKQERDELRLKIHLASMELRDDWAELEKKWESFSAQARLQDTSQDLERTLRNLGEDLRLGYGRIKAALK